MIVASTRSLGMVSKSASTCLSRIAKLLSASFIIEWYLKHTEWFHVASKSFGSVGHYPIFKHDGNRPIRLYTIKRPLGNHVVTCLRFENGTPS